MINRPFYLEKLIRYLDSEMIKVITGVRRSGKSFLLRLLKKHLLENKKQVIYLNFEDPETLSIRDGEALYNYVKEKVNKKEKAYFLFDEIGEISNWQKVVNGLRVAFDSDIYITGSNASLLSGELATYLSGRYVEINVHPLSLTEFMDFTKPANKDVALWDYIKYGGFPLIVTTENEEHKKDILKSVYESILIRDVAYRGNIKNETLLKRLSVYLLDNIGNSISSNKISGYLRSQKDNVKVETIDKYLNLLENAFIFYKAIRYDIRGKEHLKTLGKYYVSDIGLRNIALGRFDQNMGQVIENLVYLKLIRDGWDVYVGKLDDKEIDFVCFGHGRVKYVQVTPSIPKGSKRESDNLLLIKDNYEKVIVTYDYKDVGTVDGIEVIHLTDFLIEKSY